MIENTHKSVAFLDAKNERSEKENNETISLTTATKRIKYLEINLPKEQTYLRRQKNCI